MMSSKEVCRSTRALKSVLDVRVGVAVYALLHNGISSSETPGMLHSGRSARVIGIDRAR